MDILKIILDQLPGIITGVTITLISTLIIWIIARQVKKRQTFKEKKKNQLNFIDQTIEELKYNKAPGIGDSKCLFKFESIHTISIDNSGLINKILKNQLLGYIKIANLCNGDRLSSNVKPGKVKSLSSTLIKILEDLAATTSNQKF